MITVDHPVLGRVELPDDTKPEDIEGILLNLGADILPEESSGSVFFNQLGEGIESSIEGISDLTGLGFYQDSYADEFRNRVQLEQSPWAGYGGLLVGSILDPVNIPVAFLKPITFGSKLATGVVRGAAVGAAGGAVEPVFEQFGDDRLQNTLVGSVFGAGLGGALSRFIARDVPSKAETEDATEEAFQSLEVSMNRAEGYEGVEATPLPQTRTQVGVTPEEAGARASQAIATESATPLERIEADLIPVAQRGIPFNSDDYRALKFAADDAKAKLDEAEANVNKAGGNEAKKLQAQQALATARANADKTKKALDDVKEANRAQANLNALRKGAINQLSPDVRVRYNQARVESQQQARLTPTETTAPPPAVQPTTETPAPRQVTPETAEPPVAGYAPLRMGIDPRTSAGSAGVRPEQQFAGVASEGVDDTELISSAWSRKNVEPAASKGFEESPQDLQRAAMRESAASTRLRDLMGHKFGSYTFKRNPELEAETIELIGEDYDSLLDWLIRAAKERRVFNETEQRILEPLRAEAEQRITATYKTMRKMRAQGSFKSTTYTEDEYNTVMELQFYSYIADIIDTNGTRASHALKEIQNIKLNRRKNASAIKAGKPIDDIFGVKC